MGRVEGFYIGGGFRPKVSSLAAGQGKGSWNGMERISASWSQGDVNASTAFRNPGPPVERVRIDSVKLSLDLWATLPAGAATSHATCACRATRYHSTQTSPPDQGIM